MENTENLALTQCLPFLLSRDRRSHMKAPIFPGHKFTKDSLKKKNCNTRPKLESLLELQDGPADNVMLVLVASRLLLPMGGQYILSDV